MGSELKPVVPFAYKRQSRIEIEKDVDRDFFMDSDEAKKYGIVDQVVVGKK